MIYYTEKKSITLPFYFLDGINGMKFFRRQKGRRSLPTERIIMHDSINISSLDSADIYSNKSLAKRLLELKECMRYLSWCS